MSSEYLQMFKKCVTGTICVKDRSVWKNNLFQPFVRIEQIQWDLLSKEIKDTTAWMLKEPYLEDTISKVESIVLSKIPMVGLENPAIVEISGLVLQDLNTAKKRDLEPCTVDGTNLQDVENVTRGRDKTPLSMKRRSCFDPEDEKPLSAMVTKYRRSTRNRRLSTVADYGALMYVDVDDTDTEAKTVRTKKSRRTTTRSKNKKKTNNYQKNLTNNQNDHNTNINDSDCVTDTATNSINTFIDNTTSTTTGTITDNTIGTTTDTTTDNANSIAITTATSTRTDTVTSTETAVATDFDTTTQFDSTTNFNTTTKIAAVIDTSTDIATIVDAAKNVATRRLSNEFKSNVVEKPRCKGCPENLEFSIAPSSPNGPLNLSLNLSMLCDYRKEVTLSVALKGCQLSDQNATNKHKKSRLCPAVRIHRTRSSSTSTTVNVNTEHPSNNSNNSNNNNNPITTNADPDDATLTNYMTTILDPDRNQEENEDWVAANVLDNINNNIGDNYEVHMPSINVNAEEQNKEQKKRPNNKRVSSKKKATISTAGGVRAPISKKRSRKQKLYKMPVSPKSDLVRYIEEFAEPPYADSSNTSSSQIVSSTTHNLDFPFNNINGRTQLSVLVDYLSHIDNENNSTTEQHKNIDEGKESAVTDIILELDKCQIMPTVDEADKVTKHSDSPRIIRIVGAQPEMISTETQTGEVEDFVEMAVFVEPSCSETNKDSSTCSDMVQNEKEQHAQIGQTRETESFKAALHMPPLDITTPTSNHSVDFSMTNETTTLPMEFHDYESRALYEQLLNVENNAGIDRDGLRKSPDRFEDSFSMSHDLLLQNDATDKYTDITHENTNKTQKEKVQEEEDKENEEVTVDLFEENILSDDNSSKLSCMKGMSISDSKILARFEVVYADDQESEIIVTNLDTGDRFAVPHVPIESSLPNNTEQITEKLEENQAEMSGNTTMTLDNFLLNDDSPMFTIQQSTLQNLPVDLNESAVLLENVEYNYVDFAENNDSALETFDNSKYFEYGSEGLGDSGTITDLPNFMTPGKNAATNEVAADPAQSEAVETYTYAEENRNALNECSSANSYLDGNVELSEILNMRDTAIEMESASNISLMSIVGKGTGDEIEIEEHDMVDDYDEIQDLCLPEFSDQTAVQHELECDDAISLAASSISEYETLDDPFTSNTTKNFFGEHEYTDDGEIIMEQELADFIAQLFGITCLPALHNMCTNQNCKHTFNEAFVVGTKLNYLSENDLDRAYKIVCNYRTLFRKYFPLFCVQYGKQKDRKKLFVLLQDSQRYSNTESSIICVFNCLLRCGTDPAHACRNMMATVIDRSQSTIDTFVKLIMYSDWKIFCAELIEFCVCHDYKYNKATIKRMINEVQSNMEFRLVETLVQCLYTLKKSEVIELNNELPQVLNLLKIVQSGGYLNE